MATKYALSLIFLSLASAAYPAAPANVCQALDDMRLPSEAIPSDGNDGQYKIEWMFKGRVGLGNTPGRFRSILPWSVAMELPQNRLDQARIDIRSIRLSVRSRRTGNWDEVSYDGKIAGGLFLKEVGKNLREADLDVRQNTRYFSISADRNHVMHFWPKGARLTIEPDDVDGIVVSFEARMNPADYRAGARFVMNAAADYWSDNSARWDNYRTNGDAGIGRLKLLMPYWRSYNMTTVDSATFDSCV